jgi:2-amino-4-hydroxy-6-hydroxymethyldihydropteridine diphosphokinase
MAKAYLLLGGNIGNRDIYLTNARDNVSQLIGEIERSSSVYETEPWGFNDEKPFLNQVIISLTSMKPREIMDIIRNIEESLGRVRGIKDHYTSRTIDIDILFYDNVVINDHDLVIPHPRIHERRFVLQPLVEIEPGLMHPVLNKTIAVLHDECADKLQVRRLNGF